MSKVCKWPFHSLSCLHIYPPVHITYSCVMITPKKERKVKGRERVKKDLIKQKNIPIHYIQKSKSNNNHISLQSSDWQILLKLWYRHVETDEVKWSESCSVMSDSLWPHELYSPWNSPGHNTAVGSLSFLQRIPTQGSNTGLPHCRPILYQLSHK